MSHNGFTLATGLDKLLKTKHILVQLAWIIQKEQQQFLTTGLINRFWSHTTFLYQFLFWDTVA